MIWLMKAVCEREMVLQDLFLEIAILSVKEAGPSSKISHFKCSSSLKHSVSSMEEEATMMSSTWTAKIVVPVEET